MVLVIRKKQLFIALACCLVLIAVPVIWGFAQSQSVTATAAANTNWGLSFQENGKAPVGNATAEALKANNAYYCGSADSKVIYLTFDAGYENGYTPAILDTLKKHNVKATFFVVGNYIQTSPDPVSYTHLAWCCCRKRWNRRCKGGCSGWCRLFPLLPSRWVWPFSAL